MQQLAQPEYLSRKDAAAALGMSVATFDRRVKDGHIKPDLIDPVTKRYLWRPDIAERYYIDPERLEAAANRRIDRGIKAYRQKLRKQPNQ